MAGDFCLGIFFSLLLPAWGCASVRRCRGAHQHRAPRLRFENPWAAATGNSVAAAAPPADHALHCVEADVADRLGRFDSVDGGVCIWRAWSISSGARGIEP